MQSECVQGKLTCKGEAFLSLKIKSFLHSQSDHSKAYAPTLISVLNLFEIPSNQWPKILATLVGGYKFDAIWMTDHVERANLHWKKRCLIVSSWVQKQHFLLPGQLRRARLSLVKTIPYKDTMWRFWPLVESSTSIVSYYYSIVTQNAWVHGTWTLLWKTLM